MRPLPETRSRRQSDPPQLLANKRLTNGFTKEHMTTRSQAKSQIKSYKSKSKTCTTRKTINHLNSSNSSNSSASSPTRPNPYAFQYKTPASKAKATPFISNTSLKRRREQNNNHEITDKCKYDTSTTINSSDTKNGITNGTVKVKLVRRTPGSVRQKLGRKVYKHSTKAGGPHNCTSSHSTDACKSERPRGRPRKAISEHGAVAGPSSKTCVNDAKAEEGEKREEKASKRRSALWVLNCEAESFLFGETAAEKHEVELPPLSPPPKKRRMRTNELSTLLKETPILGSKLRNPSSESGESCSPCSARQRIRNDKPRIVETESEDDERVYRELNLPSPSQPPEIDCYLQSVRIQSILQSLKLKLSFESAPSKEIWYRTFSRQEQSPSTFVSPRHSPIMLPYETKSLYRRSPTKFSRLPRKSPRCHASTLAILSSLKPRTRNSISSASPPPSVSALSLPLASPSCSTLLSTVAPPPLSSPKIKCAPVHSHSTRSSSSSSCAPALNPTSSSSSHLPPLSVLTRSTSIGGSSSSALISPSSLSQSTCKNFDMTATQYLWDSIQFLSDPYVVQVLADVPSHKRVLPKGTNSSLNNSNICCPIKNISHRFEALERRASLRSESSVVSGAGGIRLVPSPKVSPRNHTNCTNINNNTTNNTINTFPLGRSSHSSKSENRSPTFNANSHHMVSSTSNSNCRKSPRKSPVVLVADIFKPKSKKVIYEEEMLFLGDGLPPLPSWPV